MRIIAGTWKGRTLAGPSGPGLRPTSDSLRETLFNILSSSVAGARVLDAFAGTGALGLEALSRGAAHATFVEMDGRALKILQENIRRCGAESLATVVRGDFARVDIVSGAGANRFDLVLLDPPYDVKDLEAILRLAAPLVAEDGRLVLEHSRRRDSPETVEPLQRTRLVLAGDSALSLYR
jgi:16S rRNA (guanine966-N2)-methyltransferase